MDPHLTPANNIWRRLFQSPVSVTKLPWKNPLLSGSTMFLEKQTQRGNPTTLPISWRGLGKKWVFQMLLTLDEKDSCAVIYFPRWLIGWILLSLLLCSAVSCGVWLATRQADRSVLFQKVGVWFRSLHHQLNFA